MRILIYHHFLFLRHVRALYDLNDSELHQVIRYLHFRYDIGTACMLAPGLEPGHQGSR